MNLAQFVAANAGRPLDYDHAFGPQCVDLVRCYIRDVLGIADELVPLPGAIDWFGKEPPHGAGFNWIRNNPKDIHQLPPRGSLMVWGPDARIGTGQYGHIAVVLAADVAGFTSFDQNWPRDAPCHQVRHNYLGIIGWGVPRIAATAPIRPPSTTTPPPQQPAPASGPGPVNPPMVSPPPLKEDAPVAITPPTPIEIPEPQPVAEAGVTTSEWKALVGYVVQLAAVETGALLAKFQLHAPDAVLNTVGTLEVLGVVAVASYVISRGIRKLGTTK